VNISFTGKDLRIWANDDRKALKALGKLRAGIFKRRLTQLKDATTLEDVRYLPGKFHELTGNRKGQWACDLDQPYRLIFKPQEEQIPSNEDHQYIWSEIKGVEIIEIINYHKEK
jgi:proteic killer suppression protein